MFLDNYPPAMLYILLGAIALLAVSLSALAILLVYRNCSHRSRSARQPAPPSTYAHLQNEDEPETIQHRAREDSLREASASGSAAWTEQMDLPAYKVVTAFTPKRRDDMRLHVGDRVTISMTFTDGVCHGFNHSTQAMGMFPISCVAVPARKPTSVASSRGRRGGADSTTTLVDTTTPGDDDDNGDTNAPQRLDFSSNNGKKGKLLFSMVAPETALEIVAESLSADRRAHYFETLLVETRGTTPTQERSANPLEAQLRASMEGASGGEPRARQAWRRLRVGWKDAVRKELDVGYEEWVRRRDRFDIWALMAENYGVAGNGWSGSTTPMAREREEEQKYNLNADTSV
ncbi:hypothetical protein HDU87_004711 [Geranomyces variabilis]|uniref:SH3 domain-containing protein n=1 Tax=Geranomyces variabilis TaxID=109894 RepID=A0AAD5TIF7_9FUNG|nr:hypothetical protein HDU87_004711 [Geranomyces variabilis]